MGRTYTTPAGRKEPLDFTINDERFLCLPSVAGSVLPDLWEMLNGDEGGTVTRESLMGFFERVMDADEFERFGKFTSDEDNIVHAQLLLEIAMDLLGDYTGRPTRRSSALQPGPTSTGPGSNPDSSSPVST